MDTTISTSWAPLRSPYRPTPPSQRAPVARILALAVLVFLIGATAAQAQCSQSIVQLYGPTPIGQTLQPNSPFAWMPPDAALTASTQTLWFNAGLGPFTFVRWLLVWLAPNVNIHARLVSMDDGPTNLTQLAQIDAAADGAMGPHPAGVIVTDAFNQMMARGRYKHIGYQIWDDGVNHPTIYSSRLELVSCPQLSRALPEQGLGGP
jgi:hypothetical protein